MARREPKSVGSNPTGPASDYLYWGQIGLLHGEVKDFCRKENQKEQQSKYIKRWAFGLVFIYVELTVSCGVD
jgi:hypothetical protein